MAGYYEWLRHYLFGDDVDFGHNRDISNYDTSFSPGDNQVFVNWLYDSENWSATDYKMFQILYGTKWGKENIDYYYNRREDEEYRRRYGIDGYGHDPRKWASSGDGIPVVSAGLNFVSNNVERLYR